MNSTSRRSQYALRINRTAQEGIVEELRARILGGELLPGAPLRQGEIAALLGVSTTPVREGLRQLAAEGMVDGDPHRGMWVHTPDSGELEEIYRVIAPLERMAMEAAAVHIDADEVAEGRDLVSRMDPNQPVKDWVELNLAFHNLLVDASRMPILAGTLRRLRNLSSLYVASSLTRSPALIERARSEHRELLEALAAHDPGRAAAIALEHLEGTRSLRLDPRTTDPAAVQASTGD
jgi:DNA-binding GntR family transcriptional regulator